MTNQAHRLALALSKLLVVSYLIALSSSLHSQRDFLPESAWHPGAPRGISNAETTMVWGFPKAFVVDHPYQGRSGVLDSLSEFHPARLGLNWLYWFGGLGTLFLGTRAISVGSTRLYRCFSICRDAQRHIPSSR